MLKGSVFFAALAVGLSACTTVDFSELAPATLTGSLFVMWVGEGNSSGDGNFVFVPDPADPLTFHRADKSLPGAEIQPGLMYTDGGSIPKIAQVFKGLSPWGYAPAYMIHDWMFVAHHCIVDKQDDKRFDQVRDVSFEDSAKILGEAIQGLVKANKVQKNDVAGTAITAAVASGIAENLWNTKGACAASKVRPEDIAAVQRAIPGAVQPAARKTFRLAPETPTTPPRGRATIVSRITF
ncbi:MAG: hypothetical protein KGI75_19080 [Rhizobiaceae bacterium]|nr:hypothetical protein [Rhizobiaceae bacterium]